MKNPWKLKPLLICATPIVGGLLQIVILGFLAGTAGSLRSNTINDVITVLVLFLPLVSLPALSAAVGGWKTKAIHSWYVAGAVLNAVYCLFLWIPIRTLIMMFSTA
jgi:hypothetical protein